jgi:hypothetical protein
MPRDPFALACLAVALAASCESETVAPVERPDSGAEALGEPGRCIKTCQTAADCCGTPLCTGVGYACEDGLCADEQCESDEDCAIEGEILERKCRVVGGRAGCYLPCVLPDDCDDVLPAFGDLACVGSADDGSKYCDAEVPVAECGVSGEPWNECPGWRNLTTACNEGKCVCRSDGECADAHVCIPSG